MRGIVSGLVSAAPLAPQLPAAYQDDEFALRWVSGFDVALAPILATLDGLDAYVDPLLAPDDFLDGLASWVDAKLDDGMGLPARREIVANAVRSYGYGGTVAGLRDVLARATGGDVEVSDSGGTSWSATPGAPMPGEPTPRLSVRVVMDDPSAVDEGWLDDLVGEITPAQVRHAVEVVAR